MAPPVTQGPALARVLLAVAGPAALVLALGTASPVLAHADRALPEPTVLTFVLDWTFDPVLQLGLLAVAAMYLLAVRRIDHAHPATPVPWARVAAFLIGLGVVEVALQSGVGTYDDTLFSVHMVQHMLLMFVAAPLLVLGTPITVVLRAARPDIRRTVALPILHGRLVRLISHPLVAWILFTTVMYGSHLSPLFDVALGNDLVHEAEHAVYLASALLFWWPVVGLDPAPWRMPHPLRVLYLFLQFPLMSFLSLAIYSAPAPLYPHYAALERAWGPSALVDQQAAGAIMWVWGDLAFLASIVLVVAAWLRDEERRTARAEGRIDAERSAIREREERLAARLAAERAAEAGEPR